VKEIAQHSGKVNRFYYTSETELYYLPYCDIVTIFRHTEHDLERKVGLLVVVVAVVVVAVLVVVVVVVVVVAVVVVVVVVVVVAI
jgi:hypothetical protein